MLGYNMFAYCNNDPVNKNDTDGSREIAFPYPAGRTLNRVKDNILKKRTGITSTLRIVAPLASQG